MTHAFRYDLIVIGGGSAGVRAARRAAESGRKVLLTEAHKLGGTCVLKGCVPKKILVYAAAFATDFEDMIGYGWNLPQKPTLDWKKLMSRKDQELERLAGLYETNVQKAGADILYGQAVFKDAHTIRIEGRDIDAQYILIATGGRPYRPPIKGIEEGLDSTGLLSVAEQPRTLTILGGGYIACEFASLFNALGTQVRMLVREDEFLLGFDNDLRQYLRETLQMRGVRIHTHVGLKEVTKTEAKNVVVVTNKGNFAAEEILVATGRQPATQELNLEAAGIKTDTFGAVLVDGYSQTSQKNIYACGDVTNRLNLTPVAIREAEAFVQTVFKGVPTAFDHRLVPSAVFTQPSLSFVGLTEQAAAAQYGEIRVYKSAFRPMKNILADREEKSFVKIIVDPKTDKVLGVHMMDPAAGEIMQAVAVAIRAGATKAVFDATVGIHPTTAEEITTLRTPAVASQNP